LPLLSSLPQALCFTNQTYSSSNVRKIAYVIMDSDWLRGRGKMGRKYVAKNRVSQRDKIGGEHQAEVTEKAVNSSLEKQNGGGPKALRRFCYE
jgi:hypothetical protein